MKPGTNNSGRRFKRNFFPRTYDSVDKARETARSVAAHFGLATIGIVITHPEISPVRSLFQQQNPVRADPSMTIANPSDLLWI
jgi:hypothetical protein